MKNQLKVIMFSVLLVSIVWTLLTTWVQYGGKQKAQRIGSDKASKKALIVYNPDPIYNLDEQVCRSFAEGLRPYGFISKLVTVKLLPENSQEYDLFVFCANTYNWAPDWRVSNCIKVSDFIRNKPVVAITVGSGSTARAQRKLEEEISDKKAQLLGSKSFWLLKPNDEKRMNEKNTDVANDMAKSFGETIGKQLSL
jgi:NAD(P)H-dependent FMN reductase